MSKIKEILTDDIYVKVTPRGSWFGSKDEAEICESQCEDIEKQIKRHIDDIGNTRIVRTYKYTYREDEYTEYEEDSVVKLCKEIAYQRGLISKKEDRTFRYFYLDSNNEKHSSDYDYFEDVLKGVINRNVIKIQGKLSDYQKILIDIAIELNDRELNIKFVE